MTRSAPRKKISVNPIGFGPLVHILSRPSFSDGAQEFLTNIHSTWREDPTATPAERLVEFAGRVCYLSFGEKQSPRSNAEYIKNLIHNGHESVLEHASWTFILSRVSRAFTHQLVRHRAGFSFSQLSQQYHEESMAEFSRPAVLAEFPAAVAAWERSVAAALSAYREILSELNKPDAQKGGSEIQRERLRAIRSAARSVLPNATETVVAVSANARALRHFFKVRGAILGDVEMRAVSAAMLSAIGPDAPTLFFDFVLDELPDGSPIVRWIDQ